MAAVTEATETEQGNAGQPALTECIIEAVRRKEGWKCKSDDLKCRIASVSLTNLHVTKLPLHLRSSVDLRTLPLAEQNLLGRLDSDRRS